MHLWCSRFPSLEQDHKVLARSLLPLLLARVLGNLTDRLTHGHVIDFLLVNLHVRFTDPGSLTSPIPASVWWSLSFIPCVKPASAAEEKAIDSRERQRGRRARLPI